MTRTTYTLTIVDAAGSKSRSPLAARLKAALKVLLRSFGLRVVTISEASEATSGNENTPTSTEAACDCGE